MSFVTRTLNRAGSVVVAAVVFSGVIGVPLASHAGATSYTVHYGSGGSQTTTVAGTSTTIVTAIAGGTAWVQANRNYGATTWTSTASVTRSYTVAVVSLCA